MLEFIQLYVGIVSEATGLLDSQIKILLCALLSFPFSAIFKRLNDKAYTIKNCYIIGVTIFYIFGILQLRSGLGPLLISTFGCYFITRYFTISSMPWINFLFLMGILAYTHLKLQFFDTYDNSKIDLSGAHMVMVMKLSSFGWDVYDGKQPERDLSDRQKIFRVQKHPNILPFIAYSFFFASLLTGPAFSYADYDRFIHNTLFDDVPLSKRPGKKARRIPRSGRVALKKVLYGFFWAACLFISKNYISLDYVLSGGLESEHGFLYRIFYFWILGFTFRLQYYTIWLIAEGACILCGIGYNGYDPTTDTFKWNRVENISPLEFELGQNCHACLEAWNKNTNIWLKHYVYLRVAKKGRKPGFKSTLFTFLSSAFWHGTQPGYYLTFMLGAFLQTLGKIYRRNLRPIFMQDDGKTPKKSKIFYDFICYLCTQLAFGYTCIPFVVLGFKNSIYVWKIAYFYIHILVLVTLFLFRGPFSKSVISYLQSLGPSLKETPKESKYKLTDLESEKCVSALNTIADKKALDIESPTLGLPSFDDLENINPDEIDEGIQEFAAAWNSFRQRRNSLNSSDIDAVRGAYSKFTNEVHEIIKNKIGSTNTKLD